VETVTGDHAMTSKALRALRDYWRSLLGDRQMPARRDIDPIHIPKLLPHVTMADVCQDPPRFRHRLLGTFVTRFFERDSTGKWLDAKLYDESTDEVFSFYHQTILRRAPVAVRQTIPFIRKDWVTLEALLMPLSDDGDGINIVFGGIDIVPGPTSTGQPIKRTVLNCDI
jgi:hypothetical protein